MDIQYGNHYTPAFKANFENNRAFLEVAKYAEETGCLRTLDTALNNIKKANRGKITLVHGKNANGEIYSFFTTGRRSVPNNTSEAQTPAEASLYGIMELSMLTKKFKSLLGVSKVEQNISAEKIIKEYTA